MILRTPRRGALFFTVGVVLVVLILAHRSRFLIALLFEDGGIDSIFYDELPPENTTLPFLVPKIIHQTYKDENLPEHWKAAQNAVKYYHPDYEYKFWTDESGFEFVKTHYPSMVSTYQSYRYPIQRVDALRYMLLHHYGGIYIDLDLFTYKPLTPLLTYPAVACRTSPTGISNDILVATPNHPFFSLVIKRLEEYNRNLIVHYITIMYTTGPLFLSAIWIEYLRGVKKGGAAFERVRVLIPRPVSGDNYGMWKNIQGGSWHGKDMYVIFWLGNHLILATLIGVAIGVVVLSVLWTVYKKFGVMFRSERWTEIQKLKEKQRQQERRRAIRKMDLLHHL